MPKWDKKQCLIHELEFYKQKGWIVKELVMAFGPPYIFVIWRKKC